MRPRIDVALDLPRMRHMSSGMTAYAEELAARLPRVAPELSFSTLVRENALDLAEQIRLPLELWRLRPRLTHFLSVYAPALTPRPYVVTIHDLIHLRFPEFFKKRVRPYYATVVRLACAGAAQVITDDERTIEDLERYLGVPPRKVSVVPLGVDETYRTCTPAARNGRSARPYFLFVGNHRPHKDLPTLFAAWESLPPEFEADLLVTGPDDVGAPHPQRERGELRFLGDVASEELARTYAGAVALVHPALREGFGLPLLEAAAVGCRVIACRDAIPAVLAPHIDAFAARDVPALRAAMQRALAEPQPVEAAREFARTLTWDRCARHTADIYRKVLLEENGPG